VSRAWRAPAVVLWRTLRNFHEDRCLDLAASLAFYGLLALAPLLYMLLVSLGAIFRDVDAAQVVVERLTAFAPADVVPAIEQLALELKRGHRFAWVALPAFLWVASSAFSSLEYAVNVAFGTAPQRKFWHSRTQAFGVLGAGWCLLSLSLVGGALARRLDGVYLVLGVERAAGPLTALGSTVAVWVVDFVTFFVFYRLLPRTRVRVRAAAAGAGFTLVLWIGVQRVFAAVVSRSPTYGLWTGTLTGAVALVLWMYVAVVVMLLGAQLAAALNGSRD